MWGRVSLAQQDWMVADRINQDNKIYVVLESSCGLTLDKIVREQHNFAEKAHFLDDKLRQTAIPRLSHPVNPIP